MAEARDKGMSSMAEMGLVGLSPRVRIVSDIDIMDMDPPLPVIKQSVEGQGGKSKSLWKRRFGGVALRILQLQPTHRLILPLLF